MPLADLDTAPLASLPSPAELRAYRRGHSALSGPRVRVRPCLGGLSYTAAMVVSAVATGVTAAAGGDPRLVMLGCVAVAAAGLGAFLCARSTAEGTCRREYRLAALAARNGLRYERGAERPIVPGMLYSEGTGRALRRFTGEIGGLPVEVGNFRHVTGRISGYVIVGDRVEIVPPIDFAEPAEWHRISRTLERLR